VGQVTLLGGLGVGGVGSYGGLVGEISRLKLYCDRNGYIKDIMKKILVFKVNQKRKGDFIKFRRKLFLN
jgi:hypothetical protein